MAAATSGVEMATHPYSVDYRNKRGLGAVADIYYPGAMICIDSATGYAVVGADTAGLLFDGLNAESTRVEVDAADAAGDKKLNVEKPFMFRMKIEAAVVTDIGRKVYVKFDNEVAYSTTNSVLAGTVEDIIDATTVLVRPYWVSTSGVNAFDGETLTFTGATTANIVDIPDNLADALSIKEGSNAYLTFVSTNSNEQLLISKMTSLLDATDLLFGTGLDAALRWSTGDADNHALVIGLGDSNQGLHVTDKAAIATDWNIAATTHPNLYLHSNTTPATDYLRLGDHDGTEADIDVVGGTTLALKIAGSTAASLTATALTFVATCFPVLPITDTDGTVEGSIWYDASEDKLKFKTAAGVETITSA